MDDFDGVDVLVLKNAVREIIDASIAVWQLCPSLPYEGQTASTLPVKTQDATQRLLDACAGLPIAVNSTTE